MTETLRRREILRIRGESGRVSLRGFSASRNFRRVIRRRSIQRAASTPRYRCCTSQSSCLAARS